MKKRKINKGILKDFEKAAEVHDNASPKMVNNLTILKDFGTVSTIPRLPITSDTSDGPNIIDLQRDTAEAISTYETEMRKRYSYLMSRTPSELKAENLYVSENGSIFQGTFEYSKVYLALDWIQKIENEAGNPGALLIHMQAPAIAKDTAGYQGGSSGTFNGQPPVVTPIPEVQALPPVIKDTETGTVTFPDGTTDAQQTTTTESLPAITTQGMAGGKYYWLWYALAALAIILFLKYGRK